MACSHTSSSPHAAVSSADDAQVHHHWSHATQHAWKRASDPMESAIKLIDSFGATCTRLPISPPDGAVSLAWACKDVLGGLAGRYPVVELAVDATCASPSASFQLNFVQSTSNRRI